MRTILAVLLVLVGSVEWATAAAGRLPVPDVRVVYIGDNLAVSCDSQHRDPISGQLGTPSMILARIPNAGSIRLPRRKRREVGGEVMYHARGKGHVCNVTFFEDANGEIRFTDLYLRMKGDPFQLLGTGAGGTVIRVRTMTFRAPSVTRATVDGADVVLFPRQ